MSSEHIVKISAATRSSRFLHLLSEVRRTDDSILIARTLLYPVPALARRLVLVYGLRIAAYLREEINFILLAHLFEILLALLYLLRALQHLLAVWWPHGAEFGRMEHGRRRAGRNIIDRPALGCLKTLVVFKAFLICCRRKLQVWHGLLQIPISSAAPGDLISSRRPIRIRNAFQPAAVRQGRLEAVEIVELEAHVVVLRQFFKILGEIREVVENAAVFVDFDLDVAAGVARAHQTHRCHRHFPARDIQIVLVQAAEILVLVEHLVVEQRHAGFGIVLRLLMLSMLEVIVQDLNGLSQAWTGLCFRKVIENKFLIRCEFIFFSAPVGGQIKYFLGSVHDARVLVKSVVVLAAGLVFELVNLLRRQLRRPQLIYRIKFLPDT